MANAGDTITVSIVADEPIIAPAVQIAGQMAAVAGSGSSWSASRVVTEMDTAGTVAFSVQFEDLASNGGVEIISTTDSSAVTIDLAAPTLVSMRIESDNAEDATRANGGDTISLHIEVSEPIVDPSVMIAGQDASVLGFATDWVASYTVVSTQVSEGQVQIQLIFEDLAGNAGDTATAVSDDSFVTIDLTPPTLVEVSIISSNEADTARANAGDIITVSLVSSLSLIHI